MKKIFFIVLLVVFLSWTTFSHSAKVNTTRQGIDYYALSSVKTGDASIVVGRGLFYGIIIRTDGSNSVTVTVYDSGSADGTTLTPSAIVVAGSTYVTGYQLLYNPGVVYTSGIYVDVTVAGGGTYSYQVLYQPF